MAVSSESPSAASSVRSTSAPVVILGGGINGCAIARELVLNGISVWLVDTADIASGATAGSSRLIHGGLRYLEYGELALVKESLAERTRLLRLAPQFVRPLRLWIPTSNRLGGSVTAVGRFFGWQWWPQHTPREGRGVWLVGAGLHLYDAYARDPLLPKHTTGSPAASGAPAVDRNRYRWLCSYYDAQVIYPERLTLALLTDAAEIARRVGLDFRVLNYHQATLRGSTVEITPSNGSAARAQTTSVQPSLIVNATGAWVDETLARLHVPSDRLMGGTKGSHLFTFSPRLRQSLAGQGIYAEAPDGRPIFITPLGDTILIGTTDESFDGPPEKAIATHAEIDYLLGAVNRIVPEASLEQTDINFHCSAVRPLPYVNAALTAAITRRHWLVPTQYAGVPLISVVGGKLTTMRSLAESVAEMALKRLARPLAANSRDRVIPGGEDYPTDSAALDARLRTIAERTGLASESVAAAWQLCGTRAESVLTGPRSEPGSRVPLLADTALPYSFVQWAIEREWARTLSDLVERRLMLLYHQRLTKACLEQLADALVNAGHLQPHETGDAVASEIARLQSRYAKRVE
jgi:glycerol-3-phosphate dehydrogenase